MGLLFKLKAVILAIINYQYMLLIFYNVYNISVSADDSERYKLHTYCYFLDI